MSKAAVLLLILKELETGIVDLLIPSPNATAEVGYNRDRYVVQSWLLLQMLVGEN